MILSNHLSSIPFFSVITPVLNGSVYASNYVKSLMNQSFSDWEALIIDDGSTDYVIQVIKNLVQGDSRFRFLHFKVEIELNS